MALIQLERGENDAEDLDADTLDSLYDKVVSETKELMEAKNHDYGEAWRDMRISSLTDLILMKLLRIKQIEDNQGSTLVRSEEHTSELKSLMRISYAVCCLKKKTKTKKK